MNPTNQSNMQKMIERQAEAERNFRNNSKLYQQHNQQKAAQASLPSLNEKNNVAVANYTNPFTSGFRTGKVEDEEVASIFTSVPASPTKVEIDSNHPKDHEQEEIIKIAKAASPIINASSKVELKEKISVEKKAKKKIAPRVIKTDLKEDTVSSINNNLKKEVENDKKGKLKRLILSILRISLPLFLAYSVIFYPTSLITLSLVTVFVIINIQTIVEFFSRRNLIKI